MPNWLTTALIIGLAEVGIVLCLGVCEVARHFGGLDG